MSIPEFDQLKAPAIQVFSDGRPRTIAELETSLAEHFQLSEEDQQEVLPSGAERRWHNRVSWACYDLFRAGLLERVKRGTYRITEEGKRVAAESPEMIDRDYLMRFPKFAEFMSSTNAQGSQLKSAPLLQAPVSNQTPEDVIESAYATLQAQLVADVVDHLHKIDPFKFERIILDVLLAMGYGGSRKDAATLTKISHDEGIDGVINEDRLGLDVIYVQAKRWQETVGRKEIQSFVGALAGKRAQKGIFITASSFAQTAREYASSLPQKVILIDGQRLAELMVEHNIGVSAHHTYLTKKVDSDYFEE